MNKRRLWSVVVAAEKELEEIERVTVDYYNGSAQRFWEGTRDHDVSQNREALLRHMSGDGPFKILDLGCGPGRDLIAFKQMGHEPVGLDACPNFCAMARQHSGCEVLQQWFLHLDLPRAAFHGVFANASLFHVPSSELPRVLAELRQCLKPNGVLFASNPRGDNSEGWNGSRYGSWRDESEWRRFGESAGFHELEHYYRPPGLPRHQQPWLATVWTKIPPAE